MGERVEGIRRRMKEIGIVFIQDGNGYRVVPGQEEAASFLADAAWTLSGALAQAERERAIQHTCTKCGYIASTQYGEGLRAEVERLKRLNDYYQDAALKAETDLARVRGFLDVTVRSWLSSDHITCDDSCSHRAEEQERFDRLDAALEGRG